MKRIAVFGGSFDPIHKGHLKIIEAVQQQVQPDRFLLIPCGTPPHRDLFIASPTQRLAMLNLACEELPYIEIDTREIDSQRLSFSHLTLSELQRENPDALLFFAMGWDSLVALPSWRNWREILRMACLLVVARAGDKRELPIEIAVETNTWGDENPEAGKIMRLDFAETDLSSTQVRDVLRNGISAEAYLLPSVCQYIQQQNIYKGK